MFRLTIPLLIAAVALLLTIAPVQADAPNQDSGHGAEPAHAEQAEHHDDEHHGDEHGDDHHGEAHGDDHGGGHGHGPGLGAVLPLWTTLPFAGILLSIAVFPLIAPHFWHEHYPKISLAWAVIFGVPFLIAYGHEAFHAILHIYLLDYIPFIILLWGLFTVSGGIVVRGAPRATPLVNTTFLFIGTMIASWIGTTGAAMVLIRPVLRANAHRKYRTHVIVFFIFLVANIGGSLTPLGDPPLFIGFLHSVPFTWTLFNMPAPMAVCVVMLLAFFFALDSFLARKEDPAPPQEDAPKLRLAGLHNSLFLLGIIGAVLMSGVWKGGEFTLLGIHMAVQNVARDVLIVAMGLLSLWTTKTALRRENEFGWGPIREVAYLFAGIFMTIVPALQILQAGEQGALAPLIRSLQTPGHYFWITGVLSAFLDNAPTYLTFFSTALGKFYPGMAEPEAVALLIAERGEYLLAISTGAVFLGACTYIGNAPNFMVKSIAEEAGIEMPSFFGYLLRWSIPFLLPVFVVVALIFFAG